MFGKHPRNTDYRRGQGSVFRAEPAAGPHEAVKVYVPDPTARVDDRTRREVDALKRLSCDTIVRLVDDGEISVRGTLTCRASSDQ
jgi:hypothetical protein